MKRSFDVASPGLTAHSCTHLIALSRGVHSYTAEVMIYAFIKMHSDDFLNEFIDGIMKSTFEHAKQALPGGGTMK